MPITADWVRGKTALGNWWAGSLIQHTDWSQPGCWPLVTKLFLSICLLTLLPLLVSRGGLASERPAVPSIKSNRPPFQPPDFRGGRNWPGVCLHSIEFQKHGGTRVANLCTSSMCRGAVNSIRQGQETQMQLSCCHPNLKHWSFNHAPESDEAMTRSPHQ